MSIDPQTQTELEAIADVAQELDLDGVALVLPEDEQIQRAATKAVFALDAAAVDDTLHAGGRP